MQTRLLKTPILHHVEQSVYVGTYDKKKWFIVNAMCYSPLTGKMYSGYFTLWRFDTNYTSLQEATNAAKLWLGTSLL